ncbi:Mth938-like domain-containing protein [Chitinasiproducens palmae]|uniref:Uncharacterized conserved protein, contains Mth938-like domain n=1 Tax=Chitinasiproducens palmae TaxID=1770053 RepID=A0A1H2PLZ6_9BURK|nr:Mth938-like domain-containing protein [Chitinasiproducens palmae]SDV47532.1 Uncharacterized conserved protein, contains Mth938-like domain [Chitinasiproducens palmae]
MKLHPDSDPSLNTVTAYDDDHVDVNKVRFTHSVIVTPDAPVRAWQVDAFETLSEASFEALAELAPEVVLLGTGRRQRFVHPRLVAALAARRIGVEAMDSGAACRTYNILMGEGRRVALALLIESAR